MKLVIPTVTQDIIKY